MQEACPIADFKTAEYQPHPQQHSNMGMLYKCSMKVISATKMRKWSQVRQRSAQMDYKKCEGQKNSVIQCCFAFFLLDFVFFWCFSCVYVHFEGKKQQPCNAYIITNNKFQKLKICIFLLHIPKNPFSPSKRAWKKRKKVLIRLNPARTIFTIGKIAAVSTKPSGSWRTYGRTSRSSKVVGLLL